MSEGDNNQSTFANFMSPKNDSEGKGFSSIIGSNKTKEALENAKNEKEKEQKKELEEAKKNSMALASRYGKADMMKLQAKNMIMMLPFLIMGVIVFLILLFKGGDWLSKGLNTLFKVMTGSK